MEELFPEMHMNLIQMKLRQSPRPAALAALLAMSVLPWAGHAQLVPDGGMAVINGVTTNLAGDLVVGTNSGPTLLVVTNGGVVSNQIGTIGLNAGAGSNEVRVAGAGSRWVNGSDLRVGDAGSHNLLVAEQGAGIESLVAYIGLNAGGVSNRVLLRGAGTTWTNGGFGIVGFLGGSSRLSIESGAAFDTASLILAFNSASASNIVEVTGAGSRLSTQGSLNVGDAGPANQLLVSASGAVHVGGNLNIGRTATSLRNRVVLSGGTLTVTNAGMNALLDLRRGTNLVTGGSLAADLILVGSAGSLLLEGGTIATRSLTNVPATPLVVGNGVSSATLQLDGAASHSIPGGVQVSANGRLLATGTLSGGLSIASGGVLEPGGGIGRLTVNGGVTLASGSQSRFQVNKAAATNDVLATPGAAALGGTLVLTNLGGTLVEGDQFQILSASSRSGAFTSVVADPPGPGLKWSISRIPVDGVLRVVSAANTAVINQFEIQNGNQAVLSAAGGVPYDPVVLLTTTNMLTPVASWQRVATNNFSAMGGVQFTNVLVTPEEQRYYRLLVE